MKVLKTKTQSTNFKSIYFENYNDKFNNIRRKLQQETERFSQKHNRFSKIGEGVGGETFKFSDALLDNLVIKTTKNGYKDDYEQEYNNLLSIPSDKIGGQEAVARVYDSSKGKYALISTFVSGKPASVINRYNDNYLKSLFDKMFELDKKGIYHGDLNGKNILLNGSGDVNFIDYQWTQIVPECNFYDAEKMNKILLPRSVFPENAQMFEMASMPYYIDKLGTASDKESFLKKYLQAKSSYHENRAKHIAKLASSWYPSEQDIIRQSLREEKAKANVYRNPSSDVLGVELKKIQFLSDYRDAYSHVDGNLPDRNIIPSSSAYLCSISAVQDLRKSVNSLLRTCYNSDLREYLKSMMEYADYWYSNLKEYTEATFDYVMRAVLNRPGEDESKHKFYINERNPRDFSPNRDILSGVDAKYKTKFDRNFDVPYNLQSKITDLYDNSARTLNANLYSNSKARHQVDKVQNISKKSKEFEKDKRYLDLLNASQLGILKIREFRGYVRHNLSSGLMQRVLNVLLENSVDFTQNLFNDIFNGLKQESAKNILVKGYAGMRQFRGKI